MIKTNPISIADQRQCLRSCLTHADADTISQPNIRSILICLTFYLSYLTPTPPSAPSDAVNDTAKTLDGIVLNGARLNDAQKKYIKALQDILQINSENDHEEQVARYLQELLSQHGIASTLVAFGDDRANLVAEISNGEGSTLIISGHMDVVSAGDASAWTHPPFSGHIDAQGVIWGRGASDMKSGLLALVFALIALHDSKAFHSTIRLLATVGEEVGEYGSKQLTELGYVDDADALLIAEPCNVGIMYAHKGSLNYKLTAKGNAAHSSTPELGNNAIERLNNAISQISEQIQQKAAQFDNPILGKTFHNITLIKGGVQVNSIPDFAEFEANARTIPEFDNQAVIDEITRVVDELNQQDGFELSLTVTADQPPVQSDPRSPLIQAILAATKQYPSLQVSALFDSMGQVLGTDLSPMAQQFGNTELAPITASGTTDAAQFTRHKKGLELAVYGPGMPMLNHKIDERLPLSQYLDFIKVYQDIITHYLQ
ncbi:ArgE/DapE family deacylase [Moraxella porci]|uniref:ArgE/DapE family deacylase n=1 Tax=Moraxella porci TaxID=1288392 RepID=UPI00244CC14B|nr:ArgE/DapE family deacylase [Moraxella porci]MDH2274272.1 ArgE/DapE family deacylase [Moraxella porci]